MMMILLRLGMGSIFSHVAFVRRQPAPSTVPIHIHFRQSAIFMFKNINSLADLASYCVEHIDGRVLVTTCLTAGRLKPSDTGRDVSS